VPTVSKRTLELAELETDPKYEDKDDNRDEDPEPGKPASPMPATALPAIALLAAARRALASLRVTALIVFIVHVLCRIFRKTTTFG
jgi:hypothetical protein